MTTVAMTAMTSTCTWNAHGSPVRVTAAATITSALVRRGVLPLVRRLHEHAHGQQVGDVHAGGQQQAADEQPAQDPVVELEVHEVPDDDHELRDRQRAEGGVVEVHA